MRFLRKLLTVLIRPFREVFQVYKFIKDHNVNKADMVDAMVEFNRKYNGRIATYKSNNPGKSLPIKYSIEHKKFVWLTRPNRR